jgi:uncharacterized protein (TIRG00374 family)
LGIIGIDGRQFELIRLNYDLNLNMRSFISRAIASPYFRLFVGLLVSSLTLYLALRNVTFSEVWAAISQADVRFIVLAFLCVVVTNLAKTYRWRVLLGEAGKRVPLFELLKALLVGQMLNTLYPMRIGDLSRAYVIGGIGPGRVFTMGTVLLEKLLDMFSYSILFILLILLIRLPAWVSNSAYSFTLVVLVSTVAIFFLAYRPGYFVQLGERVLGIMPEKFYQYTANRFRSGVASLGVLQSSAGLFRLAFWLIIVWVSAILTNFLTMRALHIQLPWTASLLVLVILQVGIAIPSVPGRLGIFEYMCILALGVFNVDQATALTYGILLHSLVMLPTLLFGMLFFAMMGLGRNREAILKNSFQPVDKTVS